VRLSHVRLLVAHFDKCFRFYRDVMGFEATFGEEGSGYADFAVGESAALALFDREEMARTAGTSALPEGEPSQDRLALIFSVEDLEATVAQLRERGATGIIEPKNHPEWGIRTAYVRDPDGTLIELNTPMPTSEWTEELRREADL
jgi:catechol 2,3-dioxygenase-like lactoylglutathione lyase family enzyme